MQVSTEQLQAYRGQLSSGFPAVHAVFDHCMTEALAALSEQGIQAYLESARFLGKMGRGAEPQLIFLQEWPTAASVVGESALERIMATVRAINKSPNGRAIAPFLQSLAAVARRLRTAELLQQYADMVLHHMEVTSGSIHGIHKTYPSPSLVDFLERAPHVLELLTIEGLRNWVEYGLRNYHHHPDQQREYFGLKSSDSRAVLQRERHGTLLVDHIRPLDLTLRALWDDGDYLVPYPTNQTATGDKPRELKPYFDSFGIRLPDVYDDEISPLGVIAGIDRYRAALAHMAGHRRWSTPQWADNLSPAQRLTVECFEDSRIEVLILRHYPGLRRLFTALHPVVQEGACDSRTQSCLRHRLALFSQAVLVPSRTTSQPKIQHFVQLFHAKMQGTESSTAEIASLALSFLAQTRLQSDQLPNTYFTDTEVSYRDDNRHLWKFIEQSDDEETFEKTNVTSTEELQTLPPRHYPEWDCNSQTYRPDWVSLYERMHPSGRASDVDSLLAKHAALAKRLKRLLDLLKPQDKVRLRYQEEGAELDLDIAIRALTDFKAGNTPDPRINMGHQHNGRSIAVTLLIDLSESLNETARGSKQTVLEVSQEAVALLAWAIEELGDPLAIAGFHSNTRHDVRYLHLKGFGEHWGDTVKGRIAAMQAGYSTRMGAAMRHAAHTLVNQKADKRLLLVLTDGQPADIDVKDENLLIQDARQAVKELSQQGIYSYCINLDAKADEYVRDIFGKQYTVVDHIAQLPEKLPKLFMALTG